MGSTEQVITVGYWDIRGLAAPIRMMCCYAGANWENVMYSIDKKEGGGWESKWFSEAKPKLRTKNALINLPYLQHNQKTITQTNAVLQYCGTLLDLGENGTDCLQLLCQVMDLRNNAVKCFYASKDQYPALIEGHMGKSVPTHYTKFENWLKQQNTTFLLGEKPSAPDFHLWEMLDQHEILAKEHKMDSFIKDYPCLTKLHATLRACPELKSYFDGPLYKLPINNKMANFGAKPIAA